MPSPLLVMLSLLLATRPVPRATACRSITWWRVYPGPTAEWPTTDRWHADDPTHAHQLELIEYVLRNYRQWGRVLRVGVKVTEHNRPPYQAADDAAATDPDVSALLRLVDANAKHVTPLSVLQRVAQLRWLGSYVDYTAYVTRTAFTCFTYNIARTALYFVWRMWELVNREIKVEAEAVKLGLPKDAFRDLHLLLTLMATKLAVVHGDQTALASTLFRYALVRLIDTDWQYSSLKYAYLHFDGYIVKRCQNFNEAETILLAGVDKNYGNIRTNCKTVNMLNEIYKLFIPKAMETYDAFDLEILPLGVWASVMDYEHPIVKTLKHLQPDTEVDPFDKLDYSWS